MQVVLFLDTRPDAPAERDAFRRYMEHGGAWMGFHFAAFALTPSKYPQNWDWYHDEFLAAGEVREQHVEADHGDAPCGVRRPSDRGGIAPHDRVSAERVVSLAARPSSQSGHPDSVVDRPSGFPLGTGPKPDEIWHSGDYPVAWTNTKYRMVYMNMGHNDMDYGGTNRALSSTFSSAAQNEFITRALVWLGTSGR